MAEPDTAALEDLMKGIRWDIPELDDALEDLLPAAEPEPQERPSDGGAGNYAEQYGVIVVCTSESHQQQVYEDLVAAGHNVKVVVT